MPTNKSKMTKHEATRHALLLRQQFKYQSSTAIIAALSFLIALTWKDLIVSLVQDNTKISVLEQYPYLPQLFTAIIATIFAILAISLISRWAKKPDAELSSKR